MCVYVCVCVCVCVRERDRESRDEEKKWASKSGFVLSLSLSLFLCSAFSGKSSRRRRAQPPTEQLLSPHAHCSPCGVRPLLQIVLQIDACMHWPPAAYSSSAHGVCASDAATAAERRRSSRTLCIVHSVL